MSDLDKKITLLSGPRQSGKTTLSKSLPFKAIEYLNFDEVGQRNKIIKKIDFLTVLENKPEYMIEVKTSDEQFSPHLRYFAERVAHVEALQLVHKLQGFSVVKEWVTIPNFIKCQQLSKFFNFLHDLNDGKLF